MQEKMRTLGSITDLNSNRKYDQKKLQSEIVSFRKRLESSGVLPNSIAILHESNSAEFFIKFFALWELNCIIVPVSLNSNTQELNRLAKLCNAQFYISRGQIRDIESKPVLKLSSGLILLSSGTTSNPKAIYIKKENIFRKIDQLSVNISTDDLRKTLCLLPLSFGHGLIGNCLLPLLTGCHLDIIDTSQVGILFLTNLSHLLSERMTTFFSTVPSFWHLILKRSSVAQKKSYLKRVHCASAPLNFELLPQMIRFCSPARLFNVYGTTESLSWVGGKQLSLTDKTTLIEEKWGADFFLSNIDRAGKQGEVNIKSDVLFSGYVNKRKLIVPIELKQGCFKTGDLGQLDENKNLLLCGRQDFVINKGGYKISPEEVDYFIQKCPAIEDCYTLGTRDPIYGQSILSIVVKKNKKKDDTKVKSELKHFLSAHLNPIKIPDIIEVVSKIPRTKRGKVDRKKIIKFILLKFDGRN